MAFDKSGRRVVVSRAKKSEAQKRYGRHKKIVRVDREPRDKKVPVCYSLPLWQVEWIDEQSRLKGLHKSTFLAALIESGRIGLDAAEMAMLANDDGMDNDEE